MLISQLAKERSDTAQLLPVCKVEYDAFKDTVTPCWRQVLCLPKWQILGPLLLSASPSQPGREQQLLTPVRSLQSQSAVTKRGSEFDRIDMKFQQVFMQMIMPRRIQASLACMAY